MTTNEIPDHYISVLDHGFVGLVDSMGDDSAIVQAARVSIAGGGVKAKSSDRGLIRYLLRKGHTTPFEMVELKFHAAMPMFVARQWVRHRTASINEQSARYGELPPLWYVPEEHKIQKQSTKNKQGRDPLSDEEWVHYAAQMRPLFDRDAKDSFAMYRAMLDEGMAREIARINLPLSTYTQWYWKIDLHNLFHFLRLRLDSHAQYEIRVYAEAMAKLIKPLVPMAWEAFEDFRLNAMTFSATELEVFALMLSGIVPTESVAELMDNAEWKTKRERDEFRQKLDVLAERIAAKGDDRGRL